MFMLHVNCVREIEVWVYKLCACQYGPQGRPMDSNRHKICCCQNPLLCIFNVRIMKESIINVVSGQTYHCQILTGYLVGNPTQYAEPLSQ